MRGAIAAATLVVMGAVACLHDVDDIRTACEIDPDDVRCRTCASADAIATACARLGACVSPMGDNRLAACTFHGSLALDCAASESLAPRGAARAFWDCLAGATTCDAVRACVYPAGVQPCAPGTARPACGGGPRAEANAVGRVDCAAPASPAPAENCAAWGLGCAGGACVPPPDCAVDCALYGAGRCAAGACVPARASDAGACVASNDVRCEGDLARACVAGVDEVVDCGHLAGSGTCAPGPLSWSAAAACGADGACDVDRCEGAVIVSCYRGRTVRMDCTTLGATGCATIDTPDGPRAACVLR